MEEIIKTRKFESGELIGTGDDLIRSEDNNNLYSYQIDYIKYDISKMYRYGEDDLKHIKHKFDIETWFSTNFSTGNGKIKKSEINDNKIKEFLDETMEQFIQKMIKVDDYGQLERNYDMDLNIEYIIGNVTLTTNGENREEYFIEIPFQVNIA